MLHVVLGRVGELQCMILAVLNEFEFSITKACFQVVVDLQIKSVSLVRLVVTSSWDCPDFLDLVDGCVCQFPHCAVAV